MIGAPNFSHMPACAGLGLTPADQAALRDVFHPVSYIGDEGRAAVRKAREVCAGCPLKANGECLTWGMDDKDGIYAGTTPDDRTEIKKLRRSRGIVGFAKSDTCAQPGRTRGVERHRSIGEPLCEACQAVETASQRRRDLDAAIAAELATGGPDTQIAKALGTHKSVVARVRRTRVVGKRVAA